MIWIEIKCDARRQGCYSSIGTDEAMGSSDNSQRDVLIRLGQLTAEAKAIGWVRHKMTWLCPRCYKRTMKPVISPG